MTRIKVPTGLDEQFRVLESDELTVRTKYINFTHAIHCEQKEIATRAKKLWREAIDGMGLEGEWRYEDGWFHTVDPPTDS